MELLLGDRKARNDLVGLHSELLPTGISLCPFSTENAVLQKLVFSTASAFPCCCKQCIFRNSSSAKRCVIVITLLTEKRETRGINQLVWPKGKILVQPISQDFHSSDSFMDLCTFGTHRASCLRELLCEIHNDFCSRQEGWQRATPLSSQKRQGWALPSEEQQQQTQAVDSWEDTASGSATSPGWMWPLHFSTGAEHN